MLRIRLRRVGAKKQPLYRIVIAENEWPRDGRFLEIVGHYNPRTNPETIQFEEERVYHFLKNGAQPTEAVARMLAKTGTAARFERLQKGEAVETLVAEAKATAESTAASTSRRTRPDTVVPSKKNRKKPEKK